ncbi:MAG: hypothetical protein Q7T44_07145 [Parvibaculum sp.]|nr:hypothetical protein [Parvibaculum sp.]
MKKLIILASVLLLAGCVSAEQQARYDAAQLQADTAECQRLGFKPATEGMSNCLLKLREIRAQEANTDELRRASAPDPWGPWGPWGPYRRW